MNQNAADPAHAGTLEGTRIGIIGATSPVASLAIARLLAQGAEIIAFSRRDIADSTSPVRWKNLNAIYPPAHRPKIPLWISFAPAYILTNHLDALTASGAQRAIMLSSTTRFTKQDSGNDKERFVAQSLAIAEGRLHAWGQAEGVQTHVLWPTLVYGNGQDKNISMIARWIERYGFFPLYGQGIGLRQPVHAEDVASASVAALAARALREPGYVLSGGEALSYREMVRRIFVAMERPPKLLVVPQPVYRLAFALMHRLLAQGALTFEMVRRMNIDMVFPHEAAARDLGFRARGFVLGPEDLPAAAPGALPLA